MRDLVESSPDGPALAAAVAPPIPDVIFCRMAARGALLPIPYPTSWRNATLLNVVRRAPTFSAASTTSCDCRLGFVGFGPTSAAPPLNENPCEEHPLNAPGDARSRWRRRAVDRKWHAGQPDVCSEGRAECVRERAMRQPYALNYGLAVQLHADPACMADVAKLAGTSIRRIDDAQAFEYAGDADKTRLQAECARALPWPSFGGSGWSPRQPNVSASLIGNVHRVKDLTLLDEHSFRRQE